MLALNWGACEGVGEESAYVRVRTSYPSTHPPTHPPHPRNPLLTVALSNRLVLLYPPEPPTRPPTHLLPPRTQSSYSCNHPPTHPPTHPLPLQAINDAVRAYVPSVRTLLSPIYFRNFCDKFAQVPILPPTHPPTQPTQPTQPQTYSSSFEPPHSPLPSCPIHPSNPPYHIKRIAHPPTHPPTYPPTHSPKQSFLPAYLTTLFRLKKINEMGTQQLLLDVYNLKTLLLQVRPPTHPPTHLPNPTHPGAHSNRLFLL